MYEYTDDDRAEIRNRVESPAYRNRAVDMGFAYEMYDVLRVMLECIGEIGSRVENIERMVKDVENVVQRRSNQND